MQAKKFLKKITQRLFLLIISAGLLISLTTMAAIKPSDSQWLQAEKMRQAGLIKNQKEAIRRIKTLSDRARTEAKASVLTENQTMDKKGKNIQNTKKFYNFYNIQNFLNFAKRQLQPSMQSIPSPPNKGLGHVLIFVSFSMPDNSLRAWMSQAYSVNGSLIIRGLIGNAFKKTISRVGRLLKGNLPNGNLLAGKSLPGRRLGVQLDPTLFKRYGIEKVPAVVVTDAGVNPNFDVVYGDVPLSTALATIAREGTESKVRAAHLLKQLREEEKQ